MMTIRPFAFLLALASTVLAKDEVPVAFEQCPQPVRTAIQENMTRCRGTLEKVEKEKKDGAEVYDAKIVDGNGKRWTLKVAPDGKIVEAKEKPKKN